MVYVSNTYKMAKQRHPIQSVTSVAIERLFYKAGVVKPLHKYIYEETRGYIMMFIRIVCEELEAKNLTGVTPHDVCMFIKERRKYDVDIHRDYRSCTILKNPQNHDELIQHYQNELSCVFLQKKGFRNLVNMICEDNLLSWTVKAVHVLQFAVEDYLMDLYRRVDKMVEPKFPDEISPADLTTIIRKTNNLGMGYDREFREATN